MDRSSEALIFESWFKEVGWKYPVDSIKNHVTLSSNGAGFTIWYSQTLNEAYLFASYW